jgi:hypothetical protein
VPSHAIPDPAAQRTWPTFSFIRFPGDDAPPWFPEPARCAPAPELRSTPLSRGKRAYSALLTADSYAEEARQALRDGDDGAVHHTSPSFAALSIWHAPSLTSPPANTWCSDDVYCQ